jgi:hypothetical protein
MGLDTIYGVRILYKNYKFCEILFRRDIDKENIFSILEDIYLSLIKVTFTFEVLVKNEVIKTWNFFENYVWNKISTSKFNNFISNKKEFLIEYFE